MAMLFAYISLSTVTFWQQIMMETSSILPRTWGCFPYILYAVDVQIPILHPAWSFTVCLTWPATSLSYFTLSPHIWISYFKLCISKSFLCMRICYELLLCWYSVICWIGFPCFPYPADWNFIAYLCHFKVLITK